MTKSKDQVVQNVRGHGLCQVLKCQELGLMFHQSVRQIPKSFFANGIIEDCHKLSPKSPLFSSIKNPNFGPFLDRGGARIRGDDFFRADV